MSTVVEKARGGAAFGFKDRYCERRGGGNGVVFVKRFSAGEAQWDARISELSEFRSLKDNWDGDGSVAPGSELVDCAVTLAKSLRRRGEEAPDRVVAGVNGTVYLEWHMPNGYYEIEVDSPISAETRWVQNCSDQVIAQSFQPNL